jgi:hypothetical protein
MFQCNFLLLLQEALQGVQSKTWRNLAKHVVTFTEAAWEVVEEAEQHCLPAMELCYPEFQAPTEDQYACRKNSRRVIPEIEEVLRPTISVDTGTPFPGTVAVVSYSISSASQFSKALHEVRS